MIFTGWPGSWDTTQSEHLVKWNMYCIYCIQGAMPVSKFVSVALRLRPNLYPGCYSVSKFVSGVLRLRPNFFPGRYSVSKFVSGTLRLCSNLYSGRYACVQICIRALRPRSNLYPALRLCLNLYPERYACVQLSICSMILTSIDQRAKQYNKITPWIKFVHAGYIWDLIPLLRLEVKHFFRKLSL